MKDPIRLRDAKSPHARAARDLLRNAVGGRASGSGFSVRGLAGPSLEQRDAMWASLAATIGPMPPGGGESGGGAGAGPDGAMGADPASAVPGGEGLAAGATATTTASGASAAKIASVASSAAKVATATAPAGKAALSLSAAKLWIALGIGAAGSVGTAAYVASPGRAPEPTQAFVAPAAVDRSAPLEAPHRHGITPDVAAAAAPLPEPKPSEPVANDAAKSDATRPAPSLVPTPSHDAKGVTAPVDTAASQPPQAAPAASSPSSATALLTPAERASRLRDEARATAEARTALRAGDAGGALRLLAAAARDFGGGSMGQEREALTIEALARSGAREAASARADSFLARFPNSTYAAAVRPFAATSIPK